MLPLVLTMPFYVLLITMIVECSLMLTQKIGSVGAAYSAARAAAVWLPYENAMPKNAPDYTPLEQRQAMVHLAAARAMWPYASGAESHASSEPIDESLNATIDQQIAAFQAYSGDQKFDMEYLKRKFAYAYNGSTIETVYLDPVSGEPYDDKETPAFNAMIQLTLRYEAPIHTYGIGRLFWEKSQFGNYFIRPVVTTVLIENEGVKKSSLSNQSASFSTNRSLGIRYYLQKPSQNCAALPVMAQIGVEPKTGRQIVLHGGYESGGFYDELAAGRELTRGRGAEEFHIDKIPDLTLYDHVTFNLHGSVDVDDTSPKVNGRKPSPDGLIDAWYQPTNGGPLQTLNVYQMARLLRRSGFRGSTIELVQCNSEQYAQDLANLMGVKVIAYPHYTTVAIFSGEVRRSDESWFGGRTTSQATPVVKYPRGGTPNPPN